MPEALEISTIRLSLYLAKCGVASRRGADSLIASGRVTVNGSVVRQPYYRVSHADVVAVDRQKITLRETVYLLFNKPAGVTTTLRDAFAAATIQDFLPQRYKGVFPVGRLDKDSSGLLILTNDGDLCYQLTHPKHRIEKEYRLVLKGALAADTIALARKGRKVEDDFLRVDELTLIARTQQITTLRAVIHEGKKRHLRRLFAALGFDVRALTRVRVGRLTLGTLKTGHLRRIDRATLYTLVLQPKKAKSAA